MFIASHAQLKTYTTYHVGGTCSRMVFPEVEADLEALPALIGDLPCLVMGNGSNVLFADKFFDAVVVNLVKWRGVTFDSAAHTLEVKSGSLISELLTAVKKHHLGGYDFLAGIPGTLGGAAWMNAGAWGKSISSLIISIEVYSLSSRRLRTIPKDKLKYAYRRQEFLQPGDIIVSVVLDAQEHDENIADKISAILTLRRQKHPVEPSCGSFFKNFPDVSAGSLIESCGLKGTVSGDAENSPRHANFIINHGRATFSDIMTLKQRAQDEVLAKHQKKLEPEVQIVDSLEHPLFIHLSRP